MSTTDDRDDAQTLNYVDDRYVSMRNEKTDDNRMVFYDKQNTDAWIQTNYIVGVGADSDHSRHDSGGCE